MGRYVLRRLAYVLPTLLGASLVCFSLLHLAPGDPATAVIPDFATEEFVEQLTMSYGFDKPLPVQYGRWLLAALGGDLGLSLTRGPAGMGRNSHPQF